MTLDSASFVDALAASLPDWRTRRFCVALSGGLDSMVLLDLMAAAGPAALRARHVDHELQTGSARWQAFCADVCRRRGVPFSAVRVAAAPEPGESPEAAARAARYAALRVDLGRDEVLLCAHHGDDQAETVLLQLLRGSGPAGLAAMPALTRCGRGWLCRPLLGYDRATLAAYAAVRGLRWVEDPSNDALSPDRNYLRHRVMPLLRERWPGLSATVARSARHSAAAAALIAERAAADLAACEADGTLLLPPLRSLGPGRQREVLRHWIRGRQLTPPDSRRLERMVEDLVAGRPGGGGAVEWDGISVRRFRDRLHLLDPAALGRMARSPRPARWAARAPLPLGDGLGTLLAEPTVGEGLAADLVGGRGLEVRWRAGGERIRTVPEGPRRRLKCLLREAGILPWMRSRVPLVYAGDRLAAVGDLWLSGDCRAAAGEAGFRIRWADRPVLR